MKNEVINGCIVFAHQKGGVGKSTLALNVFGELNRQGYPVEIIDLDIQGTLSDVWLLREDSEDGAGGAISSPRSPEAFKEKLRESLQGEHKISIIDIGGFDSELTRMAISFADLLITPLSDRTVELFGVKKFEGVLEEISAALGEKIVANIVLNNINPSKKNFTEVTGFFENSDHLHLMSSIVRRRVAFENAMANGISVVEHGKDQNAINEIQSLTAEIIDKLKQIEE